MVYITGDCHADWGKFSSDSFPEGKSLTRDDTVIVCGDFGIWHDTKEERYLLDWLNKKKFTTCFVDGNHENFDRLYSDEFEVVDFHGGKAHKIRKNIYHLMRGYIFEFDGKKFFAFGGASSHDISDGILEPNDFSSPAELRKKFNDMRYAGKMVRVNHQSWWKQEMPSQEEMLFGLKTLEANDDKVDYIITHCCPQEIASYFSHGVYQADTLTEYFNTVAHDTQFDKWYFGHYHDNQQIFGKFVMLYDKIERIL